MKGQPEDMLTWHKITQVCADLQLGGNILCTFLKITGFGKDQRSV